MRLLALLWLSSLSLTAFAGQPVPANLQPLPPPPDMTAVSAPVAASAIPTTTSAVSAIPRTVNTDDAPVVENDGVTITKQSEQTVEEYRMGGRLYMIKVTPKGGVPYYLVDDRGDGKFARQESLDTGFRPPQWIIHRF
ncbi:MAG: DUF2782 domain-containing protein [Gallionella sp.]|nr:DUF2782 domain-containing protein [Gallionella sp.]